VKIQEQKHGAVTVVKPAGPLVEEDIASFKNRLFELAQETLGRIVLDASAITFVDSKALEAMVDVAAEMGSSGQSLKLCSVSTTLREVLELTDLSGQFEHFEDANSAVRSFL